MSVRTFCICEKLFISLILNILTCVAKNKQKSVFYDSTVFWGASANPEVTQNNVIISLT